MIKMILNIKVFSMTADSSIENHMKVQHVMQGSQNNHNQGGSNGTTYREQCICTERAEKSG
jgi:hypothetical protein